MNHFETLPELKKTEVAKREIPPTREEKLLASAEIEEIRNLYGGGDNVKFIKIKEDGGGVFKEGDKYKMERAAYLVDRCLGFNFVPPTVIRAIEGKTGSFQQFIENSHVGYEFFYGKGRIPSKKEFKKLALFDFLIANSDRHEGNILFVDGKKIIAIDHGETFASPPNSRVLIFPDYYLRPGDVIPAEIRNKLKKFSKETSGQQFLRSSLGELLTKEQVDQFFQRLEYLTERTKNGNF